MKGLFQCPPWARSFCPFYGRVAMGCKGGFSRPIPVGRINSEKQE